MLFPSQQQTQTPDYDGPVGAFSLMIVAICCGVLGALGGFHAGVSRNDIALAETQHQAQASADQYAACKAWVETQKQRVESFYTDYMGIENDENQ